MLSSLSSVPPVMPSPRPEIIGTQTSSQASSGASTSETLSPMPPVECLSTFGGESLRILEHPPAPHHRGGQLPAFRGRHSAKEDRHRPGAHLVIGDFAAREAGDQELDLLGAQFAPSRFFSIRLGMCISLT